MNPKPTSPASTCFSTLLLSRKFRLLQAAALLIACNQAAGGAWDYGARVGLSSNYNDNPTLRDDGEDTDSLFKMTANYRMDIEWAEAGRSFALEPRITRDYYPDRDKSNLESTNFYIPGRFNFYGQRHSYGLNFDYREQNVLSSDSAVIDSPDTGNFRADDTKTTYLIGGNYNFILSPQDQLTLTASYINNDFDRDYTGRADSEGYSTLLNYNHSLSPRQQVGFGLTFATSDSEANDCLNQPPLTILEGEPPIPDQTIETLYIPPATFFDPCGSSQINIKRKNDSDNYSATFNYSAELTPTLTLAAKYGTRKSKNSTSLRDANGNLITAEQNVIAIDGTPVDPPVPYETPTTINDTDTDSSGDTYDISLQGIYERYSFNLGGTRRITPSQSGAPNNTTAISLNQAYEVAENLTAELDLRGSERESVVREGSDAPSRKTRVIETNLQLNWRLNRTWSVSGRYRFTHRDVDEAPGLGFEDRTASSNQVNVSINYVIKPSPR
jgi:hypothetical protein